MNANGLISLADIAISAAFTALVARQYLERKKIHQLLWGIALGLWTIAVAAELWATVNGWDVWSYRAYYATGALLIPAWLGMGTLFLTIRKSWADLILKILSALSVIGVLLILVWPLDASGLKTTPEFFVPVQLFPFFPVRLVVATLNIFGSIAFVGGALLSAFSFARQRTQGQRALATSLIAAGGLVAAGAHSLGVLGGLELFRISELIAVIFIFAGFALSTPATQTSATSVQAARS
ncbi:MAG: hypothetical protein HY070_08515 [Chloroflexi bacterium]|nr:hypothetical protein [Chloroflexota bacterium]MBI3741114.1 hypothetical protein [Chloroflexota bacterium]